jgi:hypothetical protein
MGRSTRRWCNAGRVIGCWAWTVRWCACPPTRRWGKNMAGCSAPIITGRWSAIRRPACRCSTTCATCGGLSDGGVCRALLAAVGARDLLRTAQGALGSGALQRPDRGGGGAGLPRHGPVEQCGKRGGGTGAGAPDRADGGTGPARAEVNRAVSLHALKHRLIDLLTSRVPAEQVLAVLTGWFQANPVSVRPGRQVRRREECSPSRSYHYQRRVRKIAY